MRIPSMAFCDVCSLLPGRTWAAFPRECPILGTSNNKPESNVEEVRSVLSWRRSISGLLTGSSRPETSVVAVLVNPSAAQPFGGRPCQRQLRRLKDQAIHSRPVSNRHNETRIQTKQHSGLGNSRPAPAGVGAFQGQPPAEPLAALPVPSWFSDVANGLSGGDY